MIKIPIEMPKNCHECGSFGILDLFGFECPATMEHGKYDFFNRPDGCPLRMDKKDGIEEAKSIDELKDDSTTWVQISPAKIYECKKCGHMVMTTDIDSYKFCHGCGRPVKWDV